jgi:ATP-binding cassette subfamily C protein
VSARAAFGRVRDLLAETPATEPATTLPRPAGEISVENLHYALPGMPRLILRNVSFDLSAGEALGIIGPSGAGKSTLVRHLVGVLRPSAGAVRLDGADIAVWQSESNAGYLGYLPQDIELFADTIAANISRFEPDADAAIVEAAQLAGVHEMILRLPQGYQTQVGEGGAVLSGGYRQRIALARAVFGLPSLVVLDEPSSNLDTDGDAALGDCLSQLKRRGITVIVVSHRPTTLASVDKILVLRDGAVEAFDERLEVLARLTRPEAFPATGKSVAVGG